MVFPVICNSFELASRFDASHGSDRENRGDRRPAGPTWRCPAKVADEAYSQGQLALSIVSPTTASVGGRILKCVKLGELARSCESRRHNLGNPVRIRLATGPAALLVPVMSNDPVFP